MALSDVYGWDLPDDPERFSLALMLSILNDIDRTGGPETINASRYASLNDAVTNIGASPRTLKVTSPLTAVANVTIPDNINFQFEGDGLLSVDAGVTVIPLCPLVAPTERQIFGGLGTIDFSQNRFLRLLPVGWFGAKGDLNTASATANLAAINKAISAITHPTTRLAIAKLLLTGQGYYVNGTVLADSVVGFAMEGVGRSVSARSALVPVSSAGVPVLRLRNCSYPSLSHFTVAGNASAVPSSLIELWCDTTVAPPGTVTKARLQDLVLGLTVDCTQKGVQILSTGPGAPNNDLGGFDHVDVAGAIQAAFSIEHEQSRGNEFTHCMMQLCGRGVATSLGVGGGAFKWYKGVASNNDTDFELGPLTSDAILVHGLVSEVSNRLLNCPSPSQFHQPVTIECCEFASLTPTDGRIIVYQFSGPLRVIGNYLGVAGSNVPHKIAVGAQADLPVMVAIEGNDFAALDSVTHVIVENVPGNVSKIRATYGHNKFYNLLAGDAERYDLVSYIPGRERGTVVFVGATTQIQVVLTDQPDANYGIRLAAGVNLGAPPLAALSAYYILKNTTFFFIELQAAPGGINEVRVDWEVSR